MAPASRGPLEATGGEAAVGEGRSVGARVGCGVGHLCEDASVLNGPWDSGGGGQRFGSWAHSGASIIGLFLFLGVCAPSRLFGTWGLVLLSSGRGGLIASPMGRRDGPDPVASDGTSHVTAATEHICSAAAAAPAPPGGDPSGGEHSGLVGSGGGREGGARGFRTILGWFGMVLFVRGSGVTGAALAARLRAPLSSSFGDLLVLRALAAGLTPVPRSGRVVLGPVGPVSTPLPFRVRVVSHRRAEVSSAATAHPAPGRPSWSHTAGVGPSVAAPSSVEFAATSPATPSFGGTPVWGRPLK